MDESEKEQQRRQRESALLNLTPEQRQQHKQFCRLLEENDVLTNKTAIEAARIIATERGIRRAEELRYLVQRADSQAVDELRRDQVAAERQARLAQNMRVEKEQQAARLAVQEAERLARVQHEAKKAAAREAIRSEPIPGAIERFHATVATRKAAREAEGHEAAIKRSSQTAGERPNYARFVPLKREHTESVAEPSMIKAERLTKLSESLSQDGHTVGGRLGAGRSGR